MSATDVLLSGLGLDQMVAFKNVTGVMNRLQVGAITKGDLSSLAKRFDWGFDLTGLMPLITELQRTHSEKTLMEVVVDGTIMRTIMEKAGVQPPAHIASPGTLCECPHCSGVFVLGRPAIPQG